MSDIGGMICSVYPELANLCAIIPDPNVGVRAAEERMRAVEAKRLQLAATSAPDRCTCAEQVYIEDQKLSLALYAASGRLITPAAVSGRNAALSRALRSPACSFRLEG